LPPLRIACDVDSPVFGALGAATVFGPQKGLNRADIPRLEAEGERLAALLCEHVGASAEHLTRPGAGAAGGIAFGLSVAAGARLVPGSELVSAWLALEQRLRACDCVITGEGRFDESSWAGKGPGAVVAAARAAGRPCAVFAGSVATSIAAAPSATGSACELIAISDPAVPLERALLETEQSLTRSVQAWLARVE
jgi:glycerate kinase